MTNTESCPTVCSLINSKGQGKQRRIDEMPSHPSFAIENWTRVGIPNPFSISCGQCGNPLTEAPTTHPKPLQFQQKPDTDGLLHNPGSSCVSSTSRRPRTLCDTYRIFHITARSHIRRHSPPCAASPSTSRGCLRGRVACGGDVRVGWAIFLFLWLLLCPLGPFVVPPRRQTFSDMRRFRMCEPAACGRSGVCNSVRGRLKVPEPRDDPVAGAKDRQGLIHLAGDDVLSRWRCCRLFVIPPRVGVGCDFPGSQLGQKVGKSWTT